MAAVEQTNQLIVLPELKIHLINDLDLDTELLTVFRTVSGNISFKPIIRSIIVSSSNGASMAAGGGVSMVVNLIYIGWASRLQLYNNTMHQQLVPGCVKVQCLGPRFFKRVLARFHVHSHRVLAVNDCAALWFYGDHSVLSSLNLTYSIPFVTHS